MKRTKMKELYFNRIPGSIVRLRRIHRQFPQIENRKFEIENSPIPDPLLATCCKFVQFCAILCNFVRAFYRYFYLYLAAKSGILLQKCGFCANYFFLLYHPSDFVKFYVYFNTLQDPKNENNTCTDRKAAA